VTTSARLFTIGFTQTSAEHFFERLRRAEVERVVDVRLHNASQLSGFAKRDDLEWFLSTIANIGYVHAAWMAPTEELLSEYRAGEMGWDEYERRFRALLAERRIEENAQLSDFDRVCLLCSEPTADRCHRRLVAEHLQLALGSIDVVHL
jgi:uncharacterized protein (DUF488 family)